MLNTSEKIYTDFVLNSEKSLFQHRLKERRIAEEAIRELKDYDIEEGLNSPLPIVLADLIAKLALFPKLLENEPSLKSQLGLRGFSSKCFIDFDKIIDEITKINTYSGVWMEPVSSIIFIQTFLYYECINCLFNDWGKANTTSFGNGGTSYTYAAIETKKFGKYLAKKNGHLDLKRGEIDQLICLMTLLTEKELAKVDYKMKINELFTTSGRKKMLIRIFDNLYTDESWTSLHTISDNRKYLIAHDLFNLISGFNYFKSEVEYEEARCDIKKNKSLIDKTYEQYKISSLKTFLRIRRK